MNWKMINRVSEIIVLCLSLFAMLLVIGATILTMLGIVNPSPNGDEGAAARLFQFAILLLFPTGIVFITTADWRHPLEVAKRLVIPFIALLVAFSTLFYMENIIK